MRIWNTVICSHSCLTDNLVFFSLFVMSSLFLSLCLCAMLCLFSQSTFISSPAPIAVISKHIFNCISQKITWQYEIFLSHWFTQWVQYFHQKLLWLSFQPQWCGDLLLILLLYLTHVRGLVSNTRPLNNEGCFSLSVSITPALSQPLSFPPSFYLLVLPL